jgi:hypothetical protein
MKELFKIENGILVEIRIGDERLEQNEREWAYLQIWNESEFIDLLRNRMRKSEPEVRRFLESCALNTVSAARNGRSW